MKQKRKSKIVPLLLQLFFSLVVLGCGAAVATYYLKTAPQAKPRKRAPSPLTVQVESVKYASHQVMINAMGTIVPAQEITLNSQVKGEVVAISEHLIPGGFIDKGEPLLTIDPTDYKLILLQQSSDVAKVESDLALEMGNQLIARKEFEILGENTSEGEKRLILRQPQLDHKKAALKGAQARLKQAELDLARTRIDAPFNTVILSRSVNIGSQISATTPLAHLAGTDEFWLKLSVPLEQLRWIDIPGNKSSNGSNGSEVKITVHENRSSAAIRMGRVVRLAPDLEEQGRMAVLYVSIKDPLCRLTENSHKPRLLIGSYVNAEIKGIQLKSAVAVKRRYIHNADTLWLLSENDTLTPRKIDITFKNRDYVFLSSGLQDGEKIITSPLSAPVSGTSAKLWQPGKRIIISPLSAPVEAPSAQLQQPGDNSGQPEETVPRSGKGRGKRREETP
jgi:RND family efflux transporter MFP subunit